MRQPETLTTNDFSLLSHDQPIHLPGSIQPHGILLALSEPELNILQVSNNTKAFFGIEAQNLLGQPLSVLFDAPQVAAIEQSISENLGSIQPLTLSMLTSEGERFFHAIAHRTEGAAILELEPAHSVNEANHFKFHTLARKAIAKLKKTTDLSNFLQLVVEEIQTITGFDRVMVYRFDHQGSGSVVAEALQKDLPSYLGLHYPAIDIPTQSRDLYKRGLLRFIPNMNAPFVELIPVENPATQQPLDLSLASLRSVDPCCVETHQNMGAAALQVISLIKDQQLWGLISCHHSTPKFLPYEIRNTCELLGQFITLELANKVDHEEIDYLVKLKSLLSEFIDSIAHAEDLREALVNPAPRLLDMVSAEGAAISLEDEIILVGATPTTEDVHALIEWTDTQVNDSLFHTDSLPKLYPVAEAFKDTASGLLLLRISKVRRYSVLWFRPEIIRTVNWAGNPNESVQVKEDGSKILCARTSFERWQEMVRLTSLPWKACELDIALDLRNAIVGIVLKKADELAKINLELERSNRELDSFAFAASHDLKEPLRGIHNYSTILLEDYAEVLDEEGVECLQTMVSLSQRMETLINVLLKFSQLGKVEFQLKATNLNELLSEAIEMFRASRKDLPFDIRIPRSLPSVHCDPVLVNEVFSNLLSNAFKYNDKSEPWAEVGYLDANEQREHGLPQLLQEPSESLVFYVRDNGIGIREHHLEVIFKLFKRLHAQEDYGGGTGAGLTIAKKIIERHGGRLWIESTYGEGSTFYFTLN